MKDATPRPPSVGNDPREQPGDVGPPPGKVWFRNLDEAVIEADRCVQCGSCIAACPSDSIGIDGKTGRPTLVRMCTGCSSCWDYCPRSGLRYERLLDLEKRDRRAVEPQYHAVRAQSDALSVGQDGGIVTEMLGTLLDDGHIDGALVATEHPSDPLRGVPTLATTRAEVLDAAGSVYNQIMSLGRLEDVVEETDLDDPDLALVGPPCVIQAAMAMDRYDREVVDGIALTVALMCTRNFEYDRLIRVLEKHDVDPEEVEKLDIADGVFRAEDPEGTTLLSAPVSEFDGAGLRGCEECSDFVGGAADVSAGNVGSDDGYTTVIVRTDRGRDFWKRGRDRLEFVEGIDPEAIANLSEWNERTARTALERDFRPGGNLTIPLEEHVDEYEGTDRSPRPLNPARVHQYEEWC